MTINRPFFKSFFLSGGLLSYLKVNAVLPASTAFIVNLSLAPLLTATTTNLNFGTFAPGDKAGQVKLNLDNSRSASNGIQLIGNTYNVGSVLIKGAQQANVAINLTATSITLKDPAGDSMQLQVGTGTIATASVGSMLENTQCQTDSSGNCIVYIGGVLSVGARQAPGAYTGTVYITNNYM